MMRRLDRAGLAVTLLLPLFLLHGRGIAEGDHARVFELFRRAGTQDQKGDGIGLAHVRALLRSIGGRIDLSSQLGVGTTFTVTLPKQASADTP